MRFFFRSFKSRKQKPFKLISHRPIHSSVRLKHSGLFSGERAREFAEQLGEKKLVSLKSSSSKTRDRVREEREKMHAMLQIRFEKELQDNWNIESVIQYSERSVDHSLFNDHDLHQTSIVQKFSQPLLEHCLSPSLFHDLTIPWRSLQLNQTPPTPATQLEFFLTEAAWKFYDKDYFSQLSSQDLCKTNVVVVRQLLKQAFIEEKLPQAVECLLQLLRTPQYLTSAEFHLLLLMYARSGNANAALSLYQLMQHFGIENQSNSKINSTNTTTTNTTTTNTTTTNTTTTKNSTFMTQQLMLITLFSHSIRLGNAFFHHRTNDSRLQSLRTMFLLRTCELKAAHLLETSPLWTRPWSLNELNWTLFGVIEASARYNEPAQHVDRLLEKFQQHNVAWDSTTFTLLCYYFAATGKESSIPTLYRHMRQMSVSMTPFLFRLLAFLSSSPRWIDSLNRSVLARDLLADMTDLLHSDDSDLHSSSHLVSNFEWALQTTLSLNGTPPLDSLLAYSVILRARKEIALESSQLPDPKLQKDISTFLSTFKHFYPNESVDFQELL